MRNQSAVIPILFFLFRVAGNAFRKTQTDSYTHGRSQPLWSIWIRLATAVAHLKHKKQEQAQQIESLQALVDEKGTQQSLSQQQRKILELQTELASTKATMSDMKVRTSGLCKHRLSHTYAHILLVVTQFPFCACVYVRARVVDIVRPPCTTALSKKSTSSKPNFDPLAAPSNVSFASQ